MTIHRPRKRFGQHFLHDQNIIGRIIANFTAKPGEQIVEIGPGKGALTIPLLQHYGELHVIELDRDLAQAIDEQCKDQGTLHVHSIDALNFDFSQLGNHLRIIGNLPYNISTPMIFHLLEYHHCITDMLFMLQKEVVERLSSAPGCKEYGRLSVMVQSQCEVEKLFSLGPGAFVPAPKVESAVVRLTPYLKPVVEISNPGLFAQIVKQAFAHRRKTLRNTLKDLLNEKQIESLDISPGARAEELTINQFAALSNCCHANRNQ